MKWWAKALRTRPVRANLTLQGKSCGVDGGVNVPHAFTTEGASLGISADSLAIGQCMRRLLDLDY